MKRLTGTGLALLLVSEASMAAELKVRLLNIQSAESQVVVAVYRGAEGFPKPDAAARRLQLGATPPTVETRLTDLEPGRYAVVAYHDEDGDGAMDRFLGMIPTEGYGLSRNPEVSGPPAFEDSAVELGEEGNTIEIRMRY